MECVEEFAAGGVVEQFGVGLFGDRGGGVAEQFRDDLEPEPVVEQVAAEGAASVVNTSRNTTRRRIGTSGYGTPRNVSRSTKTVTEPRPFVISSILRRSDDFPTPRRPRTY